MPDFKPKPNMKIKHNSGTVYEYIGQSSSGFHIVFNGVKAYSISSSSLEFYTEVKPNWEIDKTYTSGLTGNLYTVKQIFDNPVDDSKWTFGWYTYKNRNDSASPFVFSEKDFEDGKWTLVESS